MPVCALIAPTLLRAEVEAWVHTWIAPATKRAYRADLDHFEACSGITPVIDAMVAADHSDNGQSPRRLIFCRARKNGEVNGHSFVRATHG
jgi:hypothetical protein